MPPKSTRGGSQPLKYTSFNVVGYLNAKNVASTFAKSDQQSWFARRSTQDEWDTARESKRRRLMASEEELSSSSSSINVLTSQPPGGRVKPPRRADPTTSSTDPLARTIVIHPGSRWLRIGRASEPAPIAVPNVIARKSRQPASSAQRRDTTDHSQAPTQTPTQTQTSVRPVSPPRPSATTATPVRQGDDDVVDEANEVGSDEDDEEQNGGGGSTEEARGQRATDPLAAKIMSIKADLRARMRAYKLRGQGNGNSQAATYNSTVVPESMGEEFEGDHEWTTGEAEVWVGNKAVRIPDPVASGYVVRYPYHRGGFNTVGYVSQQEFLGDLETLYATVLEDELGIEREDLKDYSVIFLIPDLYDEVYVREMSNLLLATLGFKQLCVLQESVCSTFGAGISSACVVDIGANLTTVTCVEEGLVVPETRMVLDFGGDDITSFMHVLLERTGFPYKEADLSKWYDWIVLEDLKERSVVLSE
ncbi:hypothetical protein JCM3766R1_004922, partial [Sporobolomyces carnicolor]